MHRPERERQFPHAQSADDVADAVRSVLAGDRAAFQILVEACQATLFRMVSRYAKDQDEAMEIVQTAFIQAYEKLDTLETPEAFRAWLGRIAVRVALSTKRTHARRPMIALDDVAEPTVEPVAERDLIRRQAAATLAAELPKLTPMQREVVTLRIDAELSYREIAEALGSTEGAVRVHFHNAVSRLRAALSSQERPLSPSRTAP